MTIIITLSYLSVPTIVSLIEQSASKTIVLTPLPSLATFLKRLYPGLDIRHPERGISDSRWPHRKVLNFFTLRRQLRVACSELQTVSGADVYLLNSTFCEFEAGLFKLLGARNRLYFEPVEHMPHLQVDRSLKALLGRLWRRAVYGIDFFPLAGADITYYSVGERFRAQTGASHFRVSASRTVAEQIAQAYPDVPDRGALLLCGFTAGRLVDRDRYARCIDSVVRLLLARFGDRMVTVKSHPRHPEYVSSEASLPHLPSEIPANLVFQRFDTVVGYSSAALAEAARAGIPAISLMKLMPPLNEQVRDSHMEYLDNIAPNAIHYPVDLHQFKQLIDSGNSRAWEPTS